MHAPLFVVIRFEHKSLQKEQAQSPVTKYQSCLGIQHNPRKKLHSVKIINHGRRTRKNKTLGRRIRTNMVRDVELCV